MNNEDVLRAIFAGMALQGVLAGRICDTRTAPKVAMDIAEDMLDEFYGDADDAGIASVYKTRRAK